MLGNILLQISAVIQFGCHYIYKYGKTKDPYDNDGKEEERLTIGT